MNSRSRRHETGNAVLNHVLKNYDGFAALFRTSHCPENRSKTSRANSPTSLGVETEVDHDNDDQGGVKPSSSSTSGTK